MYRRRIIEPEPGIQPAVGAHFVVFTQSISKVQQQLFFGSLIVITPEEYSQIILPTISHGALKTHYIGKL